jgi:hypothetical protein
LSEEAALASEATSDVQVERPWEFWLSDYACAQRLGHEHWEGQTLVVETTHTKFGTQIIATVLTSGAARVTERMYLKDSKHLQIDTLLEDQGALTAPWRYSRVYERRDDITMGEESCSGNNRDKEGDEPDLTPPQ